MFPAVQRTQEPPDSHAKQSATRSSVYRQLFLGCNSGTRCTRKETFRIDTVPGRSCVLTVRNGDGRGTDEARSYEVFLNGDKVIPAHESGNAEAHVRVLSRNALKLVLTGESFRKVFIEILCDES